MFYALSANPKHLVELEKAIKAHQATPGVPYPEYVECVVKETLRRYPVLGNFVIRTSDQPEVTIECKIPDSEDLIHEYKIPEGTTISVHIWSLQNTVRQWTDPNEFNPSRWLESKDDAEPTCPKCPFIKSLSGKASAYEGLGHKEGSVSFLPFSAGARSCPSKTFVVDVLCSILLSVCSRFRLDVSEKDNFTNLPKEDPGVAMGTCIVPVLPTSCMMKVFTEGLCEMPVKEKKSNYLVEEDDYVVADEDDEVPDLGE
jgi:cytochrome P450